MSSKMSSKSQKKSSKNIYHYSETIDYSKFNFEKVESKHPTYSCIFDNKKDAVFQSPKMYCPFGIANTPIEFNANNENKFRLNMSVNTDPESEYNKDGDVSSFVNMMDGVDKVTIDFLSTISPASYGKQLSASQIKDNDKYISSVRPYVNKKKPQDNGKYPPSLVLKADVYKDGKPAFKVFNSRKQEIVLHEPLLDASGKQVTTIDKDGKEIKMFKINWDLVSGPFDAIAMMKNCRVNVVNNIGYSTWRLYSLMIFERKREEFTGDDFVVKESSSEKNEETVEDDEEEGDEEGEEGEADPNDPDENDD